MFALITSGFVGIPREKKLLHHITMYVLCIYTTERLKIRSKVSMTSFSSAYYTPHRVNPQLIRACRHSSD